MRIIYSTPPFKGSDVITVDTEANILALTPSEPRLAFATDTDKFYLYDTNDSEWKRASLQLIADEAAPDMGCFIAGGLPPYHSDRQGYYDDAIVDKALNYITIGASASDSEGAAKVASGVFKVYANSQWNDVVINFVFREDSDGNYELEHQPVGFEWYYEIMSGNSDELGIDGKPIVQQYTTSMGCYQYDLQVDGGTF